MKGSGRKKSYLIYSYEDKENNAVYVGLTVDLKNRHSKHKNGSIRGGVRKHDSVAKHFQKIGKELPYPIILKDGLDKEFKSFIDTYGSEENYLINPFYDLYVKKDLNNYISALYAVSKDKSKPDRQLINGVRSFAWYNDTILLYGIPESGIYYYDLSRNVRGSLITGDVNAEYKIKNWREC